MTQALIRLNVLGYGARNPAIDLFKRFVVKARDPGLDLFKRFKVQSTEHGVNSFQRSGTKNRKFRLVPR